MQERGLTVLSMLFAGQADRLSRAHKSPYWETGVAVVGACLVSGASTLSQRGRQPLLCGASAVLSSCGKGAENLRRSARACVRRLWSVGRTFDRDPPMSRRRRVQLSSLSPSGTAQECGHRAWEERWAAGTWAVLSPVSAGRDERERHTDSLLRSRV
ncbi:hypothetical protein COCON_G00107340 [Conger conger]|uniref:Uncharacterized protein n=1 Tax=Conger conger TaxID=82655 RepID=A0A9Q1HZS6_CONCO|nr:hypothetical protein COCON_G00107340 [Conger conger]